ncbi:hypothetical protein FIBSPDRAFT_880348 [Athelia psychrophila]|uniref:Uncharacterized protein n=1 Tax=Athelia psychrophila TaxID=1759441 RepID=A0A167T0E7_9AGAM|nr:hypothetical protein FIBSPDRAFT_880348 [Fibularhizoctonia sp. CBS 109695]
MLCQPQYASCYAWPGDSEDVSAQSQRGQDDNVNTTTQPPSLSGGAYPIATQVFPAHFSPAEFSSRYFVTGLPQTSQRGLFHYPGYTQAVCARATGQPITQAVLFTQRVLVQPAPAFKGPVHAVMGDEDFIFCLGNCYTVPPGSGGTSLLDFVAELYSDSHIIGCALYRSNACRRRANQHCRR